MNKEIFEQYKEEFENMSYCNLADEFNEPLFSITKSQDNLLKIIYINYANERDKHFELEEKINKAIKLIEDNYYSKNTTDIDSIVVSGDKLLQVRKVLKRGGMNREEVVYKLIELYFTNKNTFKMYSISLSDLIEMYEYVLNKLKGED